MNANVIFAPNTIPFSFAPKIFLAGSIEMGAAEDWQSKLTKRLEITEGVILNPRRPDWDSSWKQEKNDPQFRQQVEWELDALEQSDVIALYFDPNTKSPISLLEYGLHMRQGKVIVCCPQGFWRKGNVDIVAEKFNIPVFEDFNFFADEVAKRVQWAGAPKSDPYFDRNTCINRLYNEYLKYGKLIIATDFDETLFDFHKKGDTYYRVIELLRECSALDFYICVFTASLKGRYDYIVNYVQNLGIKVASINKNAFPMRFGNGGKIYYNILLDDRAGLGQSYEILKSVVDRIKAKK